MNSLSQLAIGPPTSIEAGSQLNLSGSDGAPSWIRGIELAPSEPGDLRQVQ